MTNYIIKMVINFFSFSHIILHKMQFISIQENLRVILVTMIAHVNRVITRCTVMKNAKESIIKDELWVWILQPWIMSPDFLSTNSACILTNDWTQTTVQVVVNEFKLMLLQTMIRASQNSDAFASECNDW